MQEVEIGLAVVALAALLGVSLDAFHQFRRLRYIQSRTSAREIELLRDTYRAMRVPGDVQ